MMITITFERPIAASFTGSFICPAKMVFMRTETKARTFVSMAGVINLANSLTILHVLGGAAKGSNMLDSLFS